MALITIISDFGGNNLYSAALKGGLLSNESSHVMIDIDLTIQKFNINEAAFVLYHSYKHFPKNTIHLVLVGNAIDEQHKRYEINRLIYCKYDEHWFVAPDNGLLSLYFNLSNCEVYSEEVYMTNGNIKDLAISIVDKISKNTFDTSKVSQPIIKQLAKPEMYDNTIIAQLIYFDKFGNGYTNLTNELLQIHAQSRSVEIFTQRRNNGVIPLGKHYSSVPEGQSICFFNSLGYLLIAVNKGNAQQLLGLALNDGIIIKLKQQSVL